MPAGVNSLSLARQLIERFEKTNENYIAPQDLSDIVQTCVDQSAGDNTVKTPAVDGEKKKKRGRPKGEGVPKAKQTWKTHKARTLNPDEDFCDCVADFGPDKICPKCKGTGIVKKQVEVHAAAIEKIVPQTPAAPAPAAAPPVDPAPGPNILSIAALAHKSPSAESSTPTPAAISPAPAPAAAPPAAAAPAAGQQEEKKEPCRWGFKTSKDGFTILFYGEPKGSSSVIGFRPRSDDECKFRANQALEKILELDIKTPYDPVKWVHVWSWQSQNEAKGVS